MATSRQSEYSDTSEFKMEAHELEEEVKQIQSQLEDVRQLFGEMESSHNRLGTELTQLTTAPSTPRLRGRSSLSLSSPTRARAGEPQTPQTDGGMTGTRWTRPGRDHSERSDTQPEERRRRMSETDAQDIQSVGSTQSSRPRTTRSGLSRNTENLEEEEQRVLNRLDSYGLSLRMNLDRVEDELKGMAEKGYIIRSRIGMMLTSKPFQVVLLLIIHLNLILIWLELELEGDSENDGWADTVWAISYTITVLFAVETAVALSLIPCRKWLQYKVMLFDTILCISVLVGETLSFLNSGAKGVKTLAALRCLRIMRFAFKLRQTSAGRPLRVMLASIGGLNWNFLWVGLLVILSVYLPSLVTRALMQDVDEDSIKDIREEFFPSLQMSIITYLHILLNSFSYHQVVIRPLLKSDDGWYIGVFILATAFFMVICLGNFVIGLFIEYILKAARESDESISKEILTEKDMNFRDLLKLFRQIDTFNLGFFTYSDWVKALESHPDLEEKLQVCHRRTRAEGAQDLMRKFSRSWVDMNSDDREHIKNRERQIFFKNLDVLGGGEVSFSDFVYGVLKTMCPAKTLDQLIFDHQFSRIVKLSGRTCRLTSEIQAYLRQHATTMHQVAVTLREHASSHRTDLHEIRKSIGRLQEDMSRITTGLDDFNPRSGLRRQVLTIQQSRKAVEINGLMQQLVSRLENATTAAELKGQEASKVLSMAKMSFLEEADRKKAEHIKIIRGHATEASMMAMDVASAAKACCEASMTSPPPTSVGVDRSGTGRRGSTRRTTLREQRSALMGSLSDLSTVHNNISPRTSPR